MDNAQKKAWSRRLPFCVTLLLLLSSFTYLFRPFWFDEVLTLDNFVMRPPLSRIYFLYEIPNNHIVFSMLEKVWIDFLALFLNTPFFLFRGLSVLAGALAVFLLAKRMVRSCGLYGGGLLCAAFAASSACAIFATGVRGYMLGFLFTVLALLFAEKIVARPTLPGFLGFFLICLLSVGTTPTNLAALEAVALFHASFLWKRKRRLPSLLYLFAAPALALVFFYAPIHGKFLRCLQLGEGWFSEGSAVWNLYASFALILLGSLPFCIAGLFHLWKRYPRLRWMCIAGFLLFLLPLPAFFVFKAPAFPRVFFPLFPIWLLAAGYAFCAYLKMVKRSPALKTLPLILQVLCTALLVNTGSYASDALFGSGRHDDITLPYYARNSFEPQKIVSLIQEKFKSGEHPLVFASFDSDYPSVLFCVSCTDLPENTVITDLPNRPRIRDLDFHTGKYYLITSGKNDLEQTMRRFGFTVAEPVWAGPFQRLDHVAK